MLKRASYRFNFGTLARKRRSQLVKDSHPSPHSGHFTHIQLLPDAASQALAVGACSVLVYRLFFIKPLLSCSHSASKGILIHKFIWKCI